MNKEQAVNIFLMQVLLKKALVEQIEKTSADQVFKKNMEMAKSSLESVKSMALAGDKEQAIAYLADMTIHVTGATVAMGEVAKLVDDRDSARGFKKTIKRIVDDFYDGMEAKLDELMEGELSSEEIGNASFVIMKAAKKFSIRFGASNMLFESSLSKHLLRKVLDCYKENQGLKDYMAAHEVFKVEYEKAIELVNANANKINKDMNEGTLVKRRDIQQRIFKAA